MVYIRDKILFIQEMFSYKNMDSYVMENQLFIIRFRKKKKTKPHERGLRFLDSPSNEPYKFLIMMMAESVIVF